MTYPLACADFSFPLLPHDDVLALIALLGFQGVDIGVFSGRSHIRPERVLENIRASARELFDKAQGSGLDIADIFLQPGESFPVLAANHPHAEDRRQSRDVFQRILEFTVRCNAKHMTGLPGIVWEGESMETSLARAAEELAWRVEQAREVGVVFAVEAHLGSLTPTPKSAARLVGMTPGLTLSLDYTHFAYQGIPDDDVEPLIRLASHFHARGAYKGRLQAPLGKNVIDYPRILRAMKRDGYAGYVGIEYVWIDWEGCNEVDNLSETIQMRDLIAGAQG